MLLDRGPTPLYYQLKSILETKIHSQEFKENDRLPSELELCKEFNVSRVTVRHALSELMKAGLIYRDRGRGTFITEGAGLKKPVLKGSIEDLIAAARGTRIKILSYKEIATPKNLSDIPRLNLTGTVFQLELVRFISKGPLGYSLIYFPSKPGRSFPFHELKETTEIITFVEETLKTKAYRADQSVDVGRADKDLERILGVKAETPTLIIRRVYYTREGTLMFVAKTYFRPDRFKYEIELTRT
jgi:GntR family transcriptional regulator